MPIASALAQSGPSLDLVSDLRQLTSYPFMVNALVAGTIVAVMAGTLGWFMVLRRQAFAGHTMSVLAFPGAAGALLVGLSPALGYFAFASLAALVLGAAAIERTRAGRAQESALTGSVQAVGLACGLLFLSLYGGVLGNYESLLFGSFLGITGGQVLALAIVAVVAICLLACALVGSFVVLRGQVLAGDALSHVAFTGAVAAAAAGIDARAGLFAATIAVAIVLGALGERTSADDVTIGVVFAWVLGLGVLF